MRNFSAALSVAKKHDRLDSYSQAVVEAVVDLELARVNTLCGQTAVEISSESALADSQLDNTLNPQINSKPRKQP